MGRKARGSVRSTALIPAETARSLSRVVTLQEAADSYLAPNTKRTYVRAWLDFFEVESPSQVTVTQALGATTQDVIAFRERLRAMKLSPGTISLKLTAVRALFDRFILEGLLTLNPAHPKLVRAPKQGNIQHMDFLDVSEIRALLRAIDRSTPRGRRDYALIMADLHLGLRRSEVLQIRVEHFKLADGSAVVSFRSKGEKERIIRVNQSLEKALAEYAQDRGKTRGWLFPGRGEKSLSGDQFWRIVQKYLKAAGIRKKVGTHGLRSSYIMRAIDQGVPLSDIQFSVGHSRPDTTLGYARDREMIKSKAPAAMEGLDGDEPS